MSLQVVPVSRVPWLPAGVGSWSLTPEVGHELGDIHVCLGEREG